MSVFRPLSGTPVGKHGLNAHASLGDEVHEWKDDRLYTFVRQSMAARRQPLDVIISTAGEKLSYGHDVWKLCQRIAAGLAYDPETLVVIYCALPTDDWTDPKVWAKANPNLGVSVKRKFLEDECRQARENPRQENDFKRYHLKSGPSRPCAGWRWRPGARAPPPRPARRCGSVCPSFAGAGRSLRASIFPRRETSPR